ncbi:uncharacterized protein BO88DRAFT_487329 [Aspergillus vadensis CBS 113365]|uniref:NWD NACHT-NTPase N-terminal domain-containing protein n=1 Tax=Aspergillus vadensis (strain CBS 113365 / IMI 142717 / IBT 24658) TaxID=1448311 RepID=A0A319BB44_ASPVC|nr:hypothetical protein BO88DRAFT_487329 [Aspergillus vadensis CBS 113365]PYH69855.1 hypothetical protein BO88DRAFT_487329 [Aspergillus vadensis CBS 113365]
MATPLDPFSALSATVPYQASLPPFFPTFCTSYEIYTFRIQLFAKGSRRTYHKSCYQGEISHRMTTSLWARALSALPDKDQRMFPTSGIASPPVSQTLTDIITAIEMQRDRCKRHKWTTTTIGGKEIIIRDFASVVNIVISYDPVHAALPWAGVRFVLQLFLNGIETFGAIVEGLETSVRVIARGGILEGSYYQKNSALSEARQALQDETVKCYTAVLKFLSLARKYYQCSRTKRAVAFMSKDDFRHCTKEIKSAEQQFLRQKGLADSEDLGNIETHVLHTILIATSTADQVNDMKAKLEKALLDLDKPVTRVVDQVSDLHRALKDNERDQTLSWISAVPAQKHLREASTSLMPGSAEWLFRHPGFQAWSNSSSSEVLWLHGTRGLNYDIPKFPYQIDKKPAAESPRSRESAQLGTNDVSP